MTQRRTRYPGPIAEAETTAGPVLRYAATDIVDFTHEAVVTETSVPGFFL